MTGSLEIVVVVVAMFVVVLKPLSLAVAILQKSAKWHKSDFACVRVVVPR